MARRLLLGKSGKRNNCNSRIAHRCLGEGFVVNLQSRRFKVNTKKIGRGCIKNAKTLRSKAIGQPVAGSLKSIPHRLKPGISFIKSDRNCRLKIGRG